MNSFDQARTVESRSMRALEPFLEETQGRFVMTNKGVLARFLQETCGDLLFNDKSGRLWGVECKAELAFTGNVFLETWSNRNLEDRYSHAERGCNVGWLYKVRADLLFYHFVDSDRLFILNMFALKRWAFARPSLKRGERANRIPPGRTNGRIWDFPEKAQAKYDQRNDTWGRCVPVSVLRNEMEVAPWDASITQLNLQLFGNGKGP